MFRRIYFRQQRDDTDCEEVVEAMLPFLTEKFGNASSIHFFGQESRAAVDKARHQVAEIINARPAEIVFTSGGTEADNLAIRGLVEANEKYGKHIITSQIEHSAVREVCQDLEKRGYEVTYLPVYETVSCGLRFKNAVRPKIQFYFDYDGKYESARFSRLKRLENSFADCVNKAEKSGFTPTRFRQSGKFPLMSKPSAAICSLFQVIKLMLRKVSERYTFGAAFGFTRKISAVARNANGAAEPNRFIKSSL